LKNNQENQVRRRALAVTPKVSAFAWQPSVSFAFFAFIWGLMFFSD
jgi:hypothetical protein